MTQEVVNDVRKELNKIDGSVFNNYERDINECFDLSNHYDMEPKISFVHNRARIYTYERGVCVYEYFTDDVDEVIFCILDIVIARMVQNMTWKRYADQEKGSLYYSDEVRQYEKEVEEEMFSQLDNKYFNWYKSGCRWLFMNPKQ